jgi:hypothetical protein
MMGAECARDYGLVTAFRHSILLGSVGHGCLMLDATVSKILKEWF